MNCISVSGAALGLLLLPALAQAQSLNIDLGAAGEANATGCAARYRPTVHRPT